MNYKEWNNWFSNVDAKISWVAWLILLRPLIDLFWFLKVPLLNMNPLEMAGIVTVVLIFVNRLKYRMVAVNRNIIYNLYVVLGILLFVNAVLIFSTGFSIKHLKNPIRMMMPVLLFFYFRNTINNKKDFEGILQTFLYSCIIPYIMILYEVLVNPIRIEYRGDLARIQGGYADVVNYGLYILLGFLIYSYFLFKKKELGKQFSFIAMVSIISVCFVGLLRINHAASLLTFGLLFMLFISNYIYTFRGSAIVVLFVGSITFIYNFSNLEIMYYQNIYPLLETDINILAGDEELKYMFHGRMSTWTRHLDSFIEDIPFIAKLIGFIGFYKPYLAGSGAHNDFLRIMYTSGFIGLGCYLLSIFLAFFKAQKIKMNYEKYFFRGIFLIVFLLSLSTTPTLYNNINYIYMLALGYMSIKS